MHSTEKSLVLAFFFDGVPVPEPAPPGDSSLVAGGTGGLSADTTHLAPVPETYYHYPYLEKECGACHLVSSMGKFTERQPAQCYQCHEDFSDRFPVLHGPAAGGYCTSCHNPHQSRNKLFLVRVGRDLCLHCHNAATLYDPEIHSGLEEMDCLECHDPHGGEDRTFMK